jgi:hypothetical protein
LSLIVDALADLSSLYHINSENKIVAVLNRLEGKYLSPPKLDPLTVLAPLVPIDAPFLNISVPASASDTVLFKYKVLAKY